MRVLYSFPHAIGRPGIGTTAWHQVNGLAALGAEVVLYCASVARPIDPRVRVIETMAVGKVRVPHRAVGVRRAYRWHDEVVARFVRKRAQQLDIVHVWPSASVRTLGVTRRMGVPSVREVPNAHTGFAFDVVAREYASVGLPPLEGHSHTANEATLRMEAEEYRLADALLVPSKYSRRTFIDRGVPADKLVLHQYGFDPSAFPEPDHHQSSTSADPGPAGPGAGLRAVFLGSIEPRKGVHHALRAWVDSGAGERGHLRLCGRFVPGYEEVLRPWLDHPSVEVTGFVTDPGAVLRQSDLLLFPSVEEGSALVTYEAQASGCALVVSDAAGARCEHLVHGLVHEAGDTGTLTSHVRMLDDDPDLLGKLRAQALGHRGELTWDYAARDLLSSYAGVSTVGHSGG